MGMGDGSAQLDCAYRLSQACLSWLRNMRPTSAVEAGVSVVEASPSWCSNFLCVSHFALILEIEEDWFGAVGVLF